MSKISAAKADKPEIDELPEGRKIEIDPANVIINTEGFAWRTVLVRVPRDFIQDDLRNRAVWQRVQKNPNVALCQLDELKIVAFDESWIAGATVAAANVESANLVVHKVQSFKTDEHRTHNDGTNEIYWRGNGYGIRRMSDKVPLNNNVYATADEAIDTLRIMRPRRAA